jgi:predicted secreted protein
MKKSIIIISIVLAVFALASCANVRISKPASSEISVTLLSNPTTGYSWTAEVEDENIATFIGSDYDAPNSEVIVGAGGAETLRFRTENPGTTNVKLIYCRPWSGEVANTHTAVITVNQDLTGSITVNY